MKSDRTSSPPSTPTNDGFLGTRFLDRLVASAPGRSFLLRFLQSTEEADEGMVFENLLARIDDPALHRMAKIHAEDEIRHAEIFRGAVARIGVTPVETIPTDLHIVARINELLGGFAARFDAHEVGVMEVYVLLQVIEERAVREWPAIAKALAAVDPESSNDVARVVRDEERHVKYAKAISRRYAPDEETLARTLRHYRAVEQQAFEENAQAFMQVVVERDLLDVGRVERAMWKGMAFMEGMRVARTRRASIGVATAA